MSKVKIDLKNSKNSISEDLAKIQISILERKIIESLIIEQSIKDYLKGAEKKLSLVEKLLNITKKALGGNENKAFNIIDFLSKSRVILATSISSFENLNKKQINDTVKEIDLTYKAVEHYVTVASKIPEILKKAIPGFSEIAKGELSKGGNKSIKDLFAKDAENFIKVLTSNFNSSEFDAAAADFDAAKIASDFAIMSIKSLNNFLGKEKVVAQQIQNEPEDEPVGEEEDEGEEEDDEEEILNNFFLDKNKAKIKTFQRTFKEKTGFNIVADSPEKLKAALLSLTSKSLDKEKILKLISSLKD